jgi:hypothetical protein
MSNLQIYMVVGLPTLTIVIALAANLVLVSGLRNGIREIRSEVKALTTRITES